MDMTCLVTRGFSRDGGIKKGRAPEKQRSTEKIDLDTTFKFWLKADISKLNSEEGRSVLEVTPHKR